MKKVIILTGVPGTGKTTVGRLLARSMRLKGQNTLQIDQDAFEPCRWAGYRQILHSERHKAEISQEFLKVSREIARTSRDDFFDSLIVTILSTLEQDMSVVLSINAKHKDAYFPQRLEAFLRSYAGDAIELLIFQLKPHATNSEIRLRARGIPDEEALREISVFREHVAANLVALPLPGSIIIDQWQNPEMTPADIVTTIESYFGSGKQIVFDPSAPKPAAPLLSKTFMPALMPHHPQSQPTSVFGRIRRWLGIS